MDIIIKDSKPKGRTRTSTDKELRDKWGTSTFKNAEDADKCAFIERKLKKITGREDSRVNASWINKIK